jgi:hypothetical protein
LSGGRFVTVRCGTKGDFEMKNKISILGIIALVVIIGFTVAACNNNPGGSPPPSGDPALPGTISISPSSGVTVGTELTATYSGDETVSYQWRRSSTNVGTNSNKFTPTEAGSYTVTVSATGFQSKTSAAVTVTAGTTELRLSNLPLTYMDETDETDFGYKYDYGGISDFLPLGDFITGTPRVEITGTGGGRRLTIELDHPKDEVLVDIDEAPGISTPGDAKWFWINFPSTSDGGYYLTCQNLGTETYLFFVYVDKDVILNGTLSAGSWYYYDLVVSELSLKSGWNFVVADHGAQITFVSATQTIPDGYSWYVYED